MKAKWWRGNGAKGSVILCQKDYKLVILWERWGDAFKILKLRWPYGLLINPTSGNVSTGKYDIQSISEISFNSIFKR